MALLDPTIRALWTREAKAGRPPSPKMVAELEYGLVANWHHEEAFLALLQKFDPSSPMKTLACREASRGLGKTTTVCFFILYAVEWLLPFATRPNVPVAKENRRVAIVGRDLNHIKDELLTQIKNLVIAHSPWLRTPDWDILIEDPENPSDEGLQKLSDMKSKGAQAWGSFRVDFSNGVSIRTRTLGQSMRNQHVFIIVGDDLLTEDTVHESGQLKSLIQSAMLPALEPGGIFLLSGTPQGPSDLHDLCRQDAENGGTWDYKCFPAYDSGGALGYAEKNRKTLGNKEFEALSPQDQICCWPARLPWAAIQQARGTTREEETTFQREYMMNRAPLDTLLIHPEDLVAAKDAARSYHPRALDGHTYYGGLDPSGLRKDEAGFCLGFVLDGKANPVEKGVRVVAHLHGMPVQPHLPAGEGELAVVHHLNETATRFRCWRWMIEKNSFQAIIGPLARSLNPSIGTPDTFHLGANKHTENGWVGLRTVFRNRQIKLPYATEEDREITDRLIHQLNGLQKIDGKIHEDSKRKNDLASALFLFIKATEESQPEYSASSVPMQREESRITTASIVGSFQSSRRGELDRNRPSHRQDMSMQAIMQRLQRWQAPRRR